MLTRDLERRIGIQFIFITHGEAGKFDMATLTMNVGSALGLLTVATFAGASAKTSGVGVARGVAWRCVAWRGVAWRGVRGVAWRGVRCVALRLVPWRVGMCPVQRREPAAHQTRSPGRAVDLMLVYYPFKNEEAQKAAKARYHDEKLWLLGGGRETQQDGGAGAGAGARSSDDV